MWYVIRSLSYDYEGLSNPTIVAVFPTEEQAKDYDLGAPREPGNYSCGIYVYKIQQFPEDNENNQEQAL